MIYKRCPFHILLYTYIIYDISKLTLSYMICSITLEKYISWIFLFLWSCFSLETVKSVPWLKFQFVPLLVEIGHFDKQKRMDGSQHVWCCLLYSQLSEQFNIQQFVLEKWQKVGEWRTISWTFLGGAFPRKISNHLSFLNKTGHQKASCKQINH